MLNNWKRFFLPFFLLAALCGLFWPGLQSGFLLDDLFNLDGLERIKLNGWAVVTQFLLEGVGSGKRPLSYLTFALQAQSWPSPYPFKLFNLILHCVNVALLFTVLRVALTLRSAERTKYVVLLPYVVAAIWAVLAIHSSTVFYVIQRMAMLAAFWMLLGMLFFLFALKAKAAIKRYLFLFAYGMCMIFGILSKENAVLLALCAALLTFCVLPNYAGVLPLWQRALLLWSPLLFLVAHLLWRFDIYFDRAYDIRAFDVGERVLTQFNVLLDYIRLILLPRVSDLRLMYENYPIAENVWDALSGIVVFVGLLTSGLVLRRRLPWVSFGILFFFACHAIESSVLALELYFEHRNYLASAGLVIALVSLCIEGVSRFSALKYPLAFVLLAWFSIQSFQLYSAAQLWSNPRLQAVEWYQNNPESHRAHGHLAKMMFTEGAYGPLSGFYAHTINLFRDDISKPLLWVELNCLSPEVALPEKQLALEIADNAIYHNAALVTIDGILHATENGRCTAEGYGLLVSILERLLLNPNFKVAERKLNILTGKALGLSGNYTQAIYFMEKARGLAFSLDVELTLAQLYLEVSDRPRFEDALSRANQYCRSGLRSLCVQYRDDLERLRFSLQADKIEVP